MRHIVSLRGHANVRDVTPNAVQWADVGTTDTGFGTQYNGSSRQIQGINQPVTFTVYYENSRSQLYYKVTNSQPAGTQDFGILDVGPSEPLFTPPSMDAIPSDEGFEITVSNGQWITFASDSDPGTVTVSLGGVEFDTFVMFAT
jgi:hypothetical protein